ncbi:Hypothetical predicted protein [Paramuricea clavata]|uniref:Uncharacterized protein n=1 Tax=Paramuricea clavata TaxID=317549 RepID=A0A7D9HRB2_PARCT|nr:Hypothetical predicted protein [Paramuricea clavata]
MELFKFMATEQFDPVQQPTHNAMGSENLVDGVYYANICEFVLSRKIGYSGNEIGSRPKQKSNGFIRGFVCNYLANHSDGQLLVELTENPSVVKFNDIGAISAIYCDYKEQSGRQLNRKLEKRIDNVKNILKLFEKQTITLEKIGSGNVCNK